MKKGLSILLIAAALFGFYGGAVNLNDVLACKDYWEEKGEQTTADMNKLEDGINQLKENEQAYLDGQVQLEEGREALAQGEADYEAGKEELAKGEADYAAAPGKLADARQQIAQGEKDLAAGEKKLANGYDQYNQGKKDLAAGKEELAAGEETLEAGRAELAKGEEELAAGKAAVAQGEEDLAKLKGLIAGINQINAGYNPDNAGSWGEGYKEFRDGRDDFLANPTDTSELEQLLAGYVQAGDPNAAEAAKAMGKAKGLLEKQEKGNYTNDQYKGFRDAMESTAEGLSAADKLLKSISDKMSEDAPAFGAVYQTGQTFGEAAATAQAKKQAAEEAFAKYQESQDPADLEAAQAAQKEAEEAKGEMDKALAAFSNAAQKSATAANKDEASIAGALKAFVKDAETQQTMLSMLDAVKAGPGITADDTDEVKAQKITAFTTANAYLYQGLNEIVSGISAKRTDEIAPSKTKAALAAGGYDQLTDPEGAAVAGQKLMIGGTADIINGVYASGNEKLIGGFEQTAAAYGLKLGDYRKTDGTNKLVQDMNASNSKLDSFFNDMGKVNSMFQRLLPSLKNMEETGEDDLAAGKEAVKVGEQKLAAGKAELQAGEAKLDAGRAVVAAGEKALAAAEKELAKGEKDLAAGKAKLADGKAQYAQGLADYEAAPAKLEDGRKQLAEGLQKLMDGREELKNGEAKLAEYEDGEQQVRDGLATLMGTKPDGGLTSILERRSGDDDFDNGDNHLELDEALEAVTVGREYQADSGVLITKEITNRAIGTAAGLGAGALAVLAAILSFLKKNKGAGVSALLSAAAGGAGVAVGTSAGTEFSSIAGSLVGATPWIAFGILGGVALVHAIAHFASKNA